MSYDPATFRTQSRKSWGAVAAGWGRNATRQLAAAMPASSWMLDAARLQPGHRVLDLAAGPGDLGFMAYELIQPGGELITSDFAPEMLTVAQEHAAERGLDGVRFKQIDMESIDIQAATLDAVLCRWGLMFVPDPNAALRECRRVLRPGGRLVLAAWADREQNPWTGLIAEEIEARGLMPRAEEGVPGQFALAREGLLQELLEEAGFVDEIEVEAISWDFDDQDFDEYWDRTMDMSRVGQAVAGLSPAEQEEFREALRAKLAPYEGDDGLLHLPARTWVAAATA
jgi:ubiquinone/menaquinone biosynthesis C-methylase UbiE